MRCLGVTGTACRARRIVPVVVRAEDRYIRPWRLRTKLYAPKAASPSAAAISRNLPKGGLIRIAVEVGVITR
jgi:hypothetical protein